MSQYERETAHSAIAVEREYQDYVARFVGTAESPRPLTLPAFQAAWERWQREYDAAWRANDTATLRALERLLAL